MFIAFAGTHGTGKTTLVSRVIQDFPELVANHEDYSLSQSTSLRKANLKGVLSIEEFQLLILSKIWFTSTFENNVGDRSFLDSLCYAKWEWQQGNISDATFKFIEEKTLELSKRMDLIFWLRPEFDIEDNGIRPVDKDFQLAIDQNFEYYFTNYSFPVIRITGSVEERYEIVKQQILNLKENEESTGN